MSVSQSRKLNLCNRHGQRSVGRGLCACVPETRSGRSRVGRCVCPGNSTCVTDVDSRGGSVKSARFPEQLVHRLMVRRVLVKSALFCARSKEFRKRITHELCKFVPHKRKFLRESSARTGTHIENYQWGGARSGSALSSSSGGARWMQPGGARSRTCERGTPARLGTRNSTYVCNETRR